ncbi:putative alanine--tRNA ligase [Nakaseomyces bracarensis]|uniref:putative alanine--tRNA ligase n=1 Tax=Nakaseomyces bracarensis TaxID=273131 RepID=UPI0038728101
MVQGKPTIVGALKCQRDTFLLSDFETTVVSCVEIKDNKKNKKKSGDTQPVATHILELEDTILFPEGGGQPSDTGYMLLNGDESQRINVLQVLREGLHAKHYVDQAVEPGTKLKQFVDKEKRLDYMQQHTGQHLLSAILDNFFENADTLSWSMGGIPTAKKPTLEPSDYLNYLELPRRLTKEEIEKVTAMFNEIVSLNVMPISVEERTADKKADETVDTKKVPDDYDFDAGILRTICIGDLDKNACCGTHMTSTSQIQGILILDNQTSVRGTNSRLYFMCGRRIGDYAKRLAEITAKTKVELSCSETVIVEKITTMKDQLQKGRKKEQYFIGELAKFESQRLYDRLLKGEKLYSIKDDYGSLELLLAIQKEFQTLCETNQKDCKETLVLCGREKTLSMGSLLVISPEAEAIQTTVQGLQGILKTLKGGGGKNGGKWQGKIMNFTDQEFSTLEEHFA